MSNNIETGKKCPNCGAEGKSQGEHETAVKNYTFPWGSVADVGWRCWNCGWEWGFEVREEHLRKEKNEYAWLRIIRKEDRMAKDNQQSVFVTDDKALREGATITKTDKEILESVRTGEGMITIESVEQLQDMAKQAAERFEEFKELCSSMELWQARIVRVLRVEKNCSWRAVAEVCYKLGWGKWSPPSNQIMGMALCWRAAQLLGEDYEKEPWN